ncbi:ABC transporter ATP-binding protein [Ferrovum myxofaciens]|uniref:ABC transporter ATP-binding protein n=2 Tax=Ferrovum myxofaciens TaxID=416213 RepID=A0A9E6MYC6_9PROT|nr:ABC transporter ATP-binding protein [Ferrovum myxofaciens]QKE38172.1 MAG: ABC transporter ATP-binding protein [Ferrovum myxofaciens]QKE40726.1 MAG: ABC transporter ATP-binding protein [Ferrovum myxofaciens]QWY75898.1 MAG: ABC transporter ATP-binding protein [Ferrovum myxofaciens]QWY78628.1 MAG: ABC transporter ATP-binding protein [Ferrovum myxofaciens]
MSSKFPEGVLACTGLGKAYTIYARPEDRLKEWLKGGHHGDTFWALRDVSLSIRPGQTVGIIGRNGSGKSTFLQMVAGILNPTEGVLHTRGRIAALLELGTGFNPEFTGRENIRLGASLLGLDPDTIEARIPDIAHFADIGHFFDYPVKLYSSGMHARLAFALVAHVDADLLIVDEALAVGDAAFSQKCMRFMREFRNRGTLCFVSHDAAAVINLCDSALWLDHGKLQAFDDARSVCREYNAMMLGQTRQQGIHRSGGRILPPPVVTEIPEPLLTAPVTEWPDCFLDTVDLVDETGASVHALRGGERLSLQLSGRIDKSDPSLNAGFIFKDRLGQALFGALTDVTLNAHCDADGSFEARFIFDLPMLRAGDFSFTAILASQCDHSLIVRARRDEAFVVRLDPQRVTHGLLPIPVEVDYRVVSRVHNFRKSES